MAKNKDEEKSRLRESIYPFLLSSQLGNFLPTTIHYLYRISPVFSNWNFSFFGERQDEGGSLSSIPHRLHDPPSLAPPSLRRLPSRILPSAAAEKMETRMWEWKRGERREVRGERWEVRGERSPHVSWETFLHSLN